MARVNVNGFKVTNYEFKKLTKNYKIEDVYQNGVEYRWKLNTGSHMRAVLVEEGYMIYVDWIEGPNDQTIIELEAVLGSPQANAQAKYDKEHTRFYGFKLNIDTDKDIIAILDKSPNKQSLFKMAMREFINSAK